MNAARDDRDRGTRSGHHDGDGDASRIPREIHADARRGGDEGDARPDETGARSAHDASAASSGSDSDSSVRSRGVASSAPMATRAANDAVPEARGEPSVEPTPEPAADDEDAKSKAEDATPSDATPSDATPSSSSSPSSETIVTPSSAEVSASFAATQYNYAASTNGAKVVSSNPEAKSPGAALKEDMDSYYLTPCGAKRGKWLTVELSEEAAVTAVTLANHEFHSSGVREFEVWGTAGARRSGRTDGVGSRGARRSPDETRRRSRCLARRGPSSCSSGSPATTARSISAR